LEKKPLVNGKPAMASTETRKVRWVQGRYFFRPPMLFTSCEASVSWMRACIEWITEPAPRNKQALKNACVST
jgi:hypothetical protein